MKAPSDIFDDTKKLIKENATKISLAAASIATIWCIYFAGKSKGETTLHVNFIAVNPEDDEYKKYVLVDK